MKFSERLGYEEVRSNLQVESISDDLKNSLWNCYLLFFLNDLKDYGTVGKNLFTNYAMNTWINYLKKPIDECPVYTDDIVIKEDFIRIVRCIIFKSVNWYDTYNLIEFTAKYADDNYIDRINHVLGKEKSGYRFINKKLVQITSREEISEIEEVLQINDIYEPIRTHISTALILLSDRENPDYRNSIKESISAVESICKIVTNDSKATLGSTIKILEKEGHIHKALKQSFSSLYGYASDSSGIRHALIVEDRKVDYHEAKFMLVVCSSFINFIIGKMKI